MSKAKPQEQQKSTIQDWTEADKTLKLIGVIDQKLKAETSEMNQKITSVQEKHQPTIDSLNAEKIGLERNLQLFCEERKDEFGDKKSKELSFGTVAFRLGTGALKTLKGFTWESVKLLVEKSAKFREYIITTTKINKDGLKTDLKEGELAKIGCYIAQEENFYYEAYERK